MTVIGIFFIIVALWPGNLTKKGKILDIILTILGTSLILISSSLDKKDLDKQKKQTTEETLKWVLTHDNPYHIVVTKKDTVVLDTTYRYTYEAKQIIK